MDDKHRAPGGTPVEKVRSDPEAVAGALVEHDEHGARLVLGWRLDPHDRGGPDGVSAGKLVLGQSEDTIGEERHSLSFSRARART